MLDPHVAAARIGRGDRGKHRPVEHAPADGRIGTRLRGVEGPVRADGDRAALVKLRGCRESAEHPALIVEDDDLAGAKACRIELVALERQGEASGTVDGIAFGLDFARVGVKPDHAVAIEVGNEKRGSIGRRQNRPRRPRDGEAGHRVK